MRRREAIRTLTGIFGTTLLVPSWANGWQENHFGKPSLLSEPQKQILTKLVDAILPKTDTPGGNELGVQVFVERMIQDCFDDSVQNRFRNELDKMDAAARDLRGKRFTELNAPERLSIIKYWSSQNDTPEKEFASSVKGLAVQGYTSSEYYLTQVSKYELVPARYHGCVDINS